jgi:23S rRNA (guanosine2251-2'-O)-methyltransferase
VTQVFVSAQRGDGRARQVADEAQARRIPVQRVPPERLDDMAGGGVHQGVCASVGPYPWVALEDILKAPPIFEGGHFLLILDQVTDPRNLGAAVRSAVSFGVDGVLLPRDRSAMPGASACKASAGALEHARLARVTNVAVTVETLKEWGVWVYGLDAGAATPLFEVDFRGPAALIIGGEQRGIRPLVRRHCDALLVIPRCGPVLSLNAAAAGTAAMYEVFRQRRTAGSSR